MSVLSQKLQHYLKLAKGKASLEDTIKQGIWIKDCGDRFVVGYILGGIHSRLLAHELIEQDEILKDFEEIKEEIDSVSN